MSTEEIEDLLVKFDTCVDDPEDLYEKIPGWLEEILEHRRNREDD